ncbi:Autophagy-related protein 17 [Cladophialophora carrionii]|uniref:Autophagy-related protein 17 n=1 Tax=Cladophialophora carrionii TaxID=86049 RepID=A0A1C1CIE8_9EURO|nr:Autophagy-related protein 17 [Cladophialophora carrionii]
MAQSPHLPVAHRHDLSARSSPSQSLRATSPSQTSVEVLVSYLVASKRSLGSIHLVHRATTLLSEARISVESTTALLAKATYLRRSLTSQLKVLRGVQFELETAAQGIQLEFQAVIRELDETGARLLQCIDLLKQTKIEHAFKVATDGERPDVAGKNTLHDFVDDNGVETIKQAMEVAIDNVQNAQQEMNDSIQALEVDLQSINEVLSSRGDLSGTESDVQQPLHIAGTLTLLENHAHEMARGLEGLVKHFDLCVTAIKHTEGGGEAVFQTMNAEEVNAVGLGVDELQAPAQPMNDEERIEMLQVLENDAQEVDEVVMELQDRNAEMETQLDKIHGWQERQETAYADVATAFKLLDKISGRLSGYVAETARHAMRWNEEKAKIEDGIGGMEELCEYYAHFLHAYDGLIVEVARRRTVKKQMERIVAEAHAQLEQMYESDRQLRLEFKSDHGEYLPSDIWSGANTLPPRYAITRADEEDAVSVPELPRRAVEEALRRLKNGNSARAGR